MQIARTYREAKRDGLKRFTGRTCHACFGNVWNMNHRCVSCHPPREKSTKPRTLHGLSYTREYHNAATRAWLKANPAKRKALKAEYRGRKIQATPKWLTKEQREEMTKIYESCPVGYEVDHIEPLNGKNRCGLHVPWNLQHLPSDENRKKSNK